MIGNNPITIPIFSAIWNKNIPAIPDATIEPMLSLAVFATYNALVTKNVYKTIIPRNIRLAEAPSHGLPINLYDSKSAGAESYRLLAEEVANFGNEEE